MSQGAGEAYAGSCFAGIGLSDLIAKRDRRLYIREDGTQGNAPYIDPETREPILDSQGRSQGTDRVSAAVFLALFTAKNSSAVPNFGLPAVPLKRDAVLESRLKANVNSALSHLVARGWVRVESVSYQSFGNAGAKVVVHWTDLASGGIQTTSI